MSKDSRIPRTYFRKPFLRFDFAPAPCKFPDTLYTVWFPQFFNSGKCKLFYKVILYKCTYISFFQKYFILATPVCHLDILFGRPAQKCHRPGGIYPLGYLVAGHDSQARNIGSHLRIVQITSYNCAVEGNTPVSISIYEKRCRFFSRRKEPDTELLFFAYKLFT